MRPKTLIIILVFIIIALVILNLLKKFHQPLRVISVLPPNGAENVDLNPPLKVQFNRQPETLSLTTHPEIDYSLQASNALVTLVLNQALKPKTRYSLTIFSKEKKAFSWSFTTRSFTESEAAEEETEMSKKLYPLIDFVPYETESFEISYEGPLFLRITIKKESVNLIKEKALDWIRSQGVNPKTHQIEWVTPEL